jgi:hypothetical protein
MSKLSEGDSMQGEVTRVNDDGSVSVRLLGYNYDGLCGAPDAGRQVPNADAPQAALRQAGLNPEEQAAVPQY